MTELKEASKASLYPRKYPMRGWVKGISVVLGVVFIISGLMFPWLPPRTHGFDPATAGCVVLCFALGIGLILGSRTNSLILYEDAIEQVGIFGTRRLAKANIAHKYTMAAYSSYLVLVPRDYKQGRGIRIEINDYMQDDVFKAWISTIPNREV